MVFSRSAQKEIMDDFSIQDERIDEALRELTVINRWLGGHETSRKGLQNMMKHIPSIEAISILDVGAGGSDLAVASLRAGITITSLDLNIRACEYSARLHPSVTVLDGSVLALPFKERSFDIIHASLFLHHFTEDELRGILPALLATARYGIVINDLRRSVLAYWGITLFTRLFSRSTMVKNDGPISVRRGFARSELVRLCASLPTSSYVIHRRWAFRWLVCITKCL
jgi:2-polyprenyl-3-methyl-5-hydroxy-6-metoxy-1,4-benzoquinol methylase